MDFMTEDNATSTFFLPALDGPRFDDQGKTLHRDIDLARHLKVPVDRIRELIEKNLESLRVLYGNPRAGLCPFGGVGYWLTDAQALYVWLRLDDAGEASVLQQFAVKLLLEVADGRAFLLDVYVENLENDLEKSLAKKREEKL